MLYPAELWARTLPVYQGHARSGAATTHSRPNSRSLAQEPQDAVAIRRGRRQDEAVRQSAIAQWGMVIPLLLAALLAAAPDADRTARIVAAPDSPVRLDSAKVLNTGAQPLVLLYAATNTSGTPLDQFTVMVFVFGADGRLKARQVAPGRHELKVGETKYSAMVLDVGTIDPTDTLMAGVDQAQQVGSDAWWRADLRSIAARLAEPQPAPSSGRRP